MKKYIKQLRQGLLIYNTFETKIVSFNPTCALFAYESLTRIDIIASFDKIGVFPLNERISKQPK